MRLSFLCLQTAVPSFSQHVREEVQPLEHLLCATQPDTCKKLYDALTDQDVVVLFLIGKWSLLVSEHQPGIHSDYSQVDV